MAYDLGDTARLRFEVRDGNDALVAPSGNVTLTITLPDGTTTATPSVANPATGVYTATYVTAQIGRHLVRWVAEGTNAASDSDILDVRAGERAWLISKADARNQLDLRGTKDDEELRDWLGAVTAVVERETGRAWVRRTRSETARGGRPGIPMIWEPIQSITSMVPLLTAGRTYQASELVWNSSGILQLRNGGMFLPGEYTIVYVAGDNTALPENVTAAARIILGHLWETQRGKGRSLPSRDDDFESFVPQGYAIPNRARELLGERIGGFA